MRGQHQLIAYRNRGLVPGCVFIDVDSTPRHLAPADWHLMTPGTAHLQIDPSDNIAALDMTCIVSLLVFVTGRDALRVQAMSRACIEAGAKRVVASVLPPDGYDFECVELTVTDSQWDRVGTTS